jgi:hypothetical protein
MPAVTLTDSPAAAAAAAAAVRVPSWLLPGVCYFLEQLEDLVGRRGLEEERDVRRRVPRRADAPAAATARG